MKHIFDVAVYKQKPIFHRAFFLLLFFFNTIYLFGQSSKVGEQKHLIYHDIRTDNEGKILPWYSKDLGTAYNFVLHAVWTYWKNIPGHWVRGPIKKDIHPGWRKELPFPPKYLIFRTLEDQGVGGDQFAQILSSWNLWYDYTGDEEVLQNMIFQADWYLKYSLSKETDAWPFIPYPCNLSEAPVYDGDLILGKDITQPDKAGSFAAELVMLYKKTGKENYLEAAIKIANTLAQHTKPGNYENSPLPFKVNAVSGEIKSPYTSNWVGTLQVFEDLIQLQKGKVEEYNNAFHLISDWLKKYPMQNNRWGPFFEDIPVWSDTEINEGSLAWYILKHPDWNENGNQQVRQMQEWAIRSLGVDHWKKYGMMVMGEQSVYKMQGQSHSARHASIELLYAAVTGDQSKKEEAIRQLNFCTYAVDHDGKCRWMNFDTYEIWWSDGYGDFVRHFIRAMDVAPELAPFFEDHILSSTSVLKDVVYSSRKEKITAPANKNSVAIIYKTFDNSGMERIRMTKKPVKILLDNKALKEVKNNSSEGFTWSHMKNGGGLLSIHRFNGRSVFIAK